MCAKSKKIWTVFFYWRKAVLTEHLDGNTTVIPGKVDFRRLRKLRQVYDDEQCFVFVVPCECQHLWIIHIHKVHVAASKSFILLTHADQVLHEPKKRRSVLSLSFDIHGLIVILRVKDHGQVKLLRVCSGKPGVAVGRPLHWCAHTISVTQMKIISHADLIAVINHRCTWH